VESRATVRSDRSEDSESDIGDRKRKRRSLAKRIQPMFVGKRDAVRLGLQVYLAT